MASSRRRTGGFAWPQVGARPFESLWSLTHRFLWLNAPNWPDLEQSFGCPALHPFSLLYGLRILSPNDRGRVSFDRARLAGALGLRSSHWWSATVAWLRGTLVDDVIAEPRYCPACLKAGYHTVAFQLPCVESCPLHGCPLSQGCPECGQPLSPLMDQAVADRPYACVHCGHALAPSSSLVAPPMVDGRPFGRILTWYRRLSTLGAVMPPACPSALGLPTSAPNWRHACLEILDGHLAPVSVAIRRHEVHAGRAVTASCGIRLTWREAWQALDERGNGPQTQIYKAYRRHVQKSLPHGSRRLMLAYVDGQPALWYPPLSREESDKRAAAYALLLFRSRMEGWPDIFEYGNPGLCRRHVHHPFRARSLPPAPFRGSDCQPTFAEGRWLGEHLYYEEIHGQFQEALTLARRMVATGSYCESPDCNWGNHQPYSVAIRRRFGVEFRSWGLPDDRRQELCEIRA